MVPSPLTNGTHLESPAPIKSSTQNICICPRLWPPRLHEKAISTTWLHNPSPRQTGGPSNMGHKIGCRVQPWHIDEAPPMFLGVLHKDMRISDNQYITNPTVSPEFHVIAAAQQLATALTGSIPAGNETAAELKKFGKLFTKIAAVKNDAPKAKTQCNRVRATQH